MEKLKGKVTVITGGSTGIGLAAARLFVEEGAHVYITGRRQAELDQARAALGKRVTTVQGDVANLDDLDRLYAQIKAEKGVIDVLVANAAFVEIRTLADSSPEHFDKTFNINARGTFFTVQKALPLLRSGASVVLVSSAAHLKGIPFYTTYAATKAALRSFTRSWAAELLSRGIRVNSLSPGPTDTGIIDGQHTTKEAADAMRAEFAKMTPMGRIGTAEEMAKGILFLASDDSSFSTGIDLAADGGLTQL